MTDNEFDTYVNSLLGGAEDVFWSTEEKAVYKTVAISLVQGQLWNLLYPIYKKSTLLDIVIDNQQPIIPSLFKIVRLEYADTGNKVPYIPDERFFQWQNQSPGDPNGWTLVEGKPYLFPKPSQSLSQYLRLWYLPIFTTLTEFPSSVHPLIAIETVIAGRFKDKHLDPATEALRMHFFMIAIKALSVSQVQDPDVVGEVGRDEEWEDE